MKKIYQIRLLADVEPLDRHGRLRNIRFAKAEFSYTEGEVIRRPPFYVARGTQVLDWASLPLSERERDRLLKRAADLIVDWGCARFSWYPAKLAETMDQLRKELTEILGG